MADKMKVFFTASLSVKKEYQKTFLIPQLNMNPELKNYMMIWKNVG